VDYLQRFEATNVGAALAAIMAWPADNPGQSQVLIAAVMARGADFAPLRQAVQQHCRAVVLLGRDGTTGWKESIAGSVPVLHVDSLEYGCRGCGGQAVPGDIVLLSPAWCAWTFRHFERARVMYSLPPLREVCRLIGLSTIMQSRPHRWFGAAVFDMDMPLLVAAMCLLGPWGWSWCHRLYGSRRWPTGQSLFYNDPQVVLPVFTGLRRAGSA